MEEEDDFGDLYADLEADVVVGISSIAVPNVIDSTDGIPIAPIVGEAEENGAAEGSESSDSDDDLRIVLNDEDCRKFPAAAQRAVLNGGMVSGWNDEEDGEDEVVVGVDGASKDQKWGDQSLKLGDGLAQGGAERGSAQGGGYWNWPVGPHSAGFSSNARSSVSGRGGWENVMIPCTGSSAFSNSGVPIAAAFSLPRYRTIFEINIDEFEHKPWKNNGADKTDYFNFGLDEESWKSYCNHMNHFRQQTTHLKTQLYDSTKPSQLLEPEMVSTKALPSDVARGEHGGKFSSNENAGFELPRGRAILVGGGIVERIPSMDTRRPRPRDTDVVIQVTIEDSVKDASVPCEQELNRVEQVDIDGSVLNSDKNLLKSPSPVHEEQRFGEIISCIDDYYPEKQAIFTGTSMEIKSMKSGAANPSRTDVFMLSDESASCDHVQRNAVSSDLESHSKASKGVSSLERFSSLSKKTSSSLESQMQESIKSDSNPSNDSRSGAIKRDEADKGYCMPECRLPVRDQKCYSRRSFQSRTSSSLTNCEKAFMHKNRHIVSYPSEVSHRKRKGHCDSDSDTRRLLYDQEIEISRRHNNRRDAEKIAGDKVYVNTFHKDGHETSFWRNRHEQDHVLEQRVATGDNGMKQRVFYDRERYYNDLQIRGASREYPNQSVSEYKSLHRVKGSCYRHKKETENRLIRMESDYNSMVFEEKYEEHRREVRGRHIPYCDSDEEIFNYEFERHVSHTSRKVRSIERRNMHELDPPFGFSRSSGCIGDDVKSWRYSNHRLADYRKHKEHGDADGDCPSPISPTKYLSSLRRSAETYAEYRRLPNGREVHSNNDEDRCYFVRGSKGHRDSHEIYSDFEFDNDDQLAEEKDLYIDTIPSSKKRACNLLAKPIPCTDDIKVKHRGRKGLSSTEGLSFRDRSLRHERTLVSEYSGSVLKFSDDHLFNSVRKETVTAGCSRSDIRGHGSFISEIFDNGRQELEFIGRSEAVNIHVNGLKGKFPKRSRDITHESKGQSGINTRNKKLKNTEVKLRKEVSPTTLKVENFIHSNLQTERLKNMSQCSENHIIQNYHGKNSTQPVEDDDEIEEGQLIEEPDVQDVISVVKDDNSHKKVAYPATESSQSNSVEKNRLPKDLTGDNRVVGEFNSDRILETLAKMEKRRERFKVPIPVKPIPEKIQSSQLEAAVATEEVQQQRPARKRRWAGS